MTISSPNTPLTTDFISEPKSSDHHDSSDHYHDSSPSFPSPSPNTQDPAYKTAILGIPDKVWQSARTNELEDYQRDWVYTWTEKNPYHRQELLTDKSAETFVLSKFAKTRPDLVELYTSIPIPILRADLLRYLMVLAEGGVWSDLDATCEKDISEWVPEKYRDEEIDMIVGLEFDMEWRGEGTPLASQFCNWVFAARPSSRHLQAVVDAVADTLRGIAAEYNVPMQMLQLEMLSDVVDVTGPKIMSVSVLKSLSEALNRTVDDRDFHDIKQPKLIGDLLIMPGNSFAAAQNGFPDDQSDALVSHHYWGSWKDADKDAKEHKKQAAAKQEDEAEKHEEATEESGPQNETE